MNNSLTNASYIKILTKVDVTSKHQIPKLNSWFSKYTSGILVGLIPTFLGTFASMFVFLNGFPVFFNSLGIHFGFSFSQLTLLRHIALVLAFGISLYFAYSHLHSNYKSFKRAKQLEISENMIAEKNHLMIKLTSQLNFWNKVFYQILLIQDLYFYFSNTEVTQLSNEETA